MKYTIGLKNIIAVVSLLLLASCKEGSTDSIQNDAGQLIPLALNNMWIHKSEYYDSLGTITGSRIDTMRITGDTLIGGQKWYRYNYSINSYYTNKKEGFYSYVESPVLEYKYPANVGDTFMIASGLKHEVISTNALITVNNRSFITYHYHSSYPDNVTDLSWDEFIAPNVGQVRIDAYRKNSQSQKYLTLRWDLLGYKLY